MTREEKIEEMRREAERRKEGRIRNVARSGQEKEIEDDEGKGGQKGEFLEKMVRKYQGTEG